MLGFKGNISDFWSDSLKNYQYKNKTPFRGMREHWHENYNTDGYILQSFNEELPNNIYEKFYSSLNVNDGTVAWTCLIPNTILPPHIDKFYVLSKKLNLTQDQCLRYVIFLEDWCFGQYVQLDQTPILNWKKGDVWYFDWTINHYAVNASNYDFHSCQVSTEK
jgi:hypothetical protein